jgi:hypothetical protein
VRAAGSDHALPGPESNAEPMMLRKMKTLGPVVVAHSASVLT